MEGKKLYSNIGHVFYEKKIKQLSYIGCGCNAKVYRLNKDKAIKIFMLNENLELYHIAKRIMNLNLPNFYQIYELLADKRFFPQNYLGNIASYHEPEDIDILEMPSDWLIENYEGLCEAAIKLGEKKIRMDDVGPKNSIVNSKGITVIDTDFYYETSYFCANDNLKIIQEDLLISLLKDSASVSHLDFLFVYSVLRKLFKQDNDNTKTFAKVLSRYPKPIDYINDRIQR